MRRTASLFALACALALLAPGLPHAQAGLQKRPPAGSPQPGGCGSDPVAGTWRAQAYGRGRTVQWTLQIRRRGSALTGRIGNLTWYGAQGLAAPPPCRGGLAYRVSMAAQGTYGPGNRVDFYGVGAYRVDRVLCGSLGNYNLDHFSGSVSGERMDVRNDDGGAARGDRYVFRRTRCP